jgi:copper chaperone
MSNVILSVPDISCGHCEKTVTNALVGKPGVNTVRVDIPAKQVYLDYDQASINLEQISEILDEEGYAVADVIGAGASAGAGAGAGEVDKPRRSFIPLFKR